MSAPNRGSVFSLVSFMPAATPTATSAALPAATSAATPTATSAATPTTTSAATPTATSAATPAALNAALSAARSIQPAGRALSALHPPPTVSISIFVDRMVLPNLNVTHTAAGWARILISVGVEIDLGFINSSVRQGAIMLKSIFMLPTWFTLDSIIVCGPDLHCSIDDIRRAVQFAWDSVSATVCVAEMTQAASLTQAPSLMQAHSLAETAAERVLQRISAGGGTPNFSLNTVKGITSSHNFISSTRGNAELTSEEIEAVRVTLAGRFSI